MIPTHLQAPLVPPSFGAFPRLLRVRNRRPVVSNPPLQRLLQLTGNSRKWGGLRRNNKTNQENLFHPARRVFPPQWKTNTPLLHTQTHRAANWAQGGTAPGTEERLCWANGPCFHLGALSKASQTRMGGETQETLTHRVIGAMWSLSRWGEHWSLSNPTQQRVWRGILAQILTYSFLSFKPCWFAPFWASTWFYNKSSFSSSYSLELVQWQKQPKRSHE